MNSNKSNPVILLVDDDTQIRRLLRLILERDGFLVIEADSGLSALSLWRGHGQTIDLLITDLDMPGMTGLQFLAALQATKADLKTVLISGNCIEFVPESVSFLQKPFSADQLVAAVRIQLNRRTRVISDDSPVLNTSLGRLS